MEYTLIRGHVIVLKKLYDKYLPGWANEPELFVRADMIPDRELWDAHLEAKRILIDYVNTAYNMNMGCETLTIGFARRFATYKKSVSTGLLI